MSAGRRNVMVVISRSFFNRFFSVSGIMVVHFVFEQDLLIQQDDLTGTERNSISALQHSGRSFCPTYDSIS
jgi:hypothetical protein